jgi:hypothetical protein
VSLAIWPIAAAARLLSPNVTPTDASIASPAWMSTVLSTNPNATNGTALKRKTSRSWRRVTGGDAVGDGDGAALDAYPRDDDDDDDDEPDEPDEARREDEATGESNARRRPRDSATSRENGGGGARWRDAAASSRDPARRHMTIDACPARDARRRV